MADALSPEHVYAKHLATLDQDAAKASLRKARFLSLQEASDETFDAPIQTAREYLESPIEVPPSLVWPTIVVRGEITTTLGRAGKGKTSLNLCRILRWAAGVPLFEDWLDEDGNAYLCPEKPLKTLVIENEGNAGMFHQKLGIMTSRPQYLKEHERDLALENVLIWEKGGYSGFKLDDDTKVNVLRAGCEKWQPDIVFIEPFRSLWRGEENSSTEMSSIIDVLQQVAVEFDCGVILSHHERISGVGEDGELMSAARGSSALEGVVALMEHFAPVVDGEFRELQWSKARYLQPPPPTRMHYEVSDGWYTHVPAAAIEERILLVLQESDDALTHAQLAEATDEKPQKVSSVMKKMVADDRVRRLGSQGEGYRYRSRALDDPDDSRLSF